MSFWCVNFCLLLYHYEQLGSGRSALVAQVSLASKILRSLKTQKPTCLLFEPKAFQPRFVCVEPHQGANFWARHLKFSSFFEPPSFLLTSTFLLKLLLFLCVSELKNVYLILSGNRINDRVPCLVSAIML